MKIKDFFGKLNQFFFSEIPAESYAVFRIVFGLLVAVNFLFELNNLDTFYGPQAILSLDTVKSQFSYPHFSLFEILPNTNNSLYFIVAIYAIGIIGFVFGVFSNWSALLMFSGMMSMHHRNIWLLSSCDLLMRILLFILIFAPIGKALSIDSYVAKLRGEKTSRNVSAWAWRLIQIHIAVLYVSTVYAKIKGDMWFDGSAIYYATRLDDMIRFPVPYFLDHQWSIKLLTWGTLVVEFSLGTLIWFKELRYPLIIIGVLFHLGIEYMMTIPFFELLMIVSLISFIYPEDIRTFVEKVRSKILVNLQNAQVNEKLKTCLIRIVE